MTLFIFYSTITTICKVYCDWYDLITWALIVKKIGWGNTLLSTGKFNKQEKWKFFLEIDFLNNYQKSWYKILSVGFSNNSLKVAIF